MQSVFVKAQGKQEEWSHIGWEETEGEVRFAILLVGGGDRFTDKDEGQTWSYHFLHMCTVQCTSTKLANRKLLIQ